MSLDIKKWNDSFREGREYNLINEVLLDATLNRVQKRQAAIDLGCGTGDAVIKLAKRGFNVVGVDWSSEALQKALCKIEEAGVAEKVHFQEVNLNETSKIVYELGTVDLVLSKLVIAFVENKSDFCKYAKSLLAPGGVFVLITPVLYPEYTYTPEDKPQIAVSHKETLEMLTGIFANVDELNHSYYGERGDLVTFVCS